MAKWGEIKCPRCEELKDRLNYAVGEREDYEKIIKQLQAEWLANRVAIMRLEAKLAQQNDLVQAANRLAEYLNGNPIYMERVHYLAAAIRKGGE